MKDIIYDHYIAIDWSIKNMVIARMRKKSNAESSLRDLLSAISS